MEELHITPGRMVLCVLRSIQAVFGAAPLQRPAAAGGAQRQQHPQHQHQQRQQHRLPLSSENPPIGAVPHPRVVCSQPAGNKSRLVTARRTERERGRESRHVPDTKSEAKIIPPSRAEPCQLSLILHNEIVAHHSACEPGRRAHSPGCRVRVQRRSVRIL